MHCLRVHPVAIRMNLVKVFGDPNQSLNSENQRLESYQEQIRRETCFVIIAERKLKPAHPGVPAGRR